MVDPMPDPRAAVIAYLRANAAVTTIVAEADIASHAPAGGSPRPYLFVGWSPGIGSRPYTPEFVMGIDLRCYGTTTYQAGLLWRTVHAVLEGDRQRNGFTAAGCRVKNLTFATGPIDDTNLAEWPNVYVSYNALVSEVPVS